jgi:hypothetical protein
VRLAFLINVLLLMPADLAMCMPPLLLLGLFDSI